MNNLDKKKIDASHINVTLKPIFNIKPELYIPILYGMGLLVLLFVLFILPGIIKHGSVVNITSYPSNASVYINDNRVGSTPLNIFVEKGENKIVIKKDKFREQSLTKDIKGGLFFTLFNKREDFVHLSMTSDSGSEILNSSFLEASRWSLVNSLDINNRYRIPSVISNGVKDYFHSTDFNSDILNNYLTSSLKLITNEYLLSDYIRAIVISASDNRLPSISSIKNSIQFIDKTISKKPNTPILIYNKIVKNSNTNSNSDYITILKDRHKKIIDKSVISFGEDKKNIKIGNMVFNYIPESNIKPIDVNFIHNIKQDDFYILNNMVRKSSYLDFVNENPRWREDNIDNLILENLADKYYMKFESEEEYITHVSYFAAKAWCVWANETFEIPDGWTLKLPSENRWHAANTYGSLSNVDAWQWTDQGFYLYDHFLTDLDGNFSDEFTDIIPRLVVGNNKYNNRVESGRGVQDANWCTPFLSFRPILVKE